MNIIGLSSIVFFLVRPHTDLIFMNFYSTVLTPNTTCQHPLLDGHVLRHIVGLCHPCCGQFLVGVISIPSSALLSPRRNRKKISTLRCPPPPSSSPSSLLLILVAIIVDILHVLHTLYVLHTLHTLLCSVVTEEDDDASLSF